MKIVLLRNWRHCSGAKAELVWVDIPDCDDDCAHMLSEVFAFQPLAIRDCVERNRVPKVHGYGDHVLIVLHAPSGGSAATCTTSRSTRS